MPNWVHAGFRITGDREELRRFAGMMIKPMRDVGKADIPASASPPDAELSGGDAAAEQRLTLDFNGIIPEPAAEQLANMEGWANEHWGTKWNARSVDVRILPDSVWFQFSTPWDFPEPVFRALAKEFPTLVFSGSAYEDSGEYELLGEFNGSDSWGYGKIEWM